MLKIFILCHIYGFYEKVSEFILLDIIKMISFLSKAATQKHVHHVSPIMPRVTLLISLHCI